MPRKNDRRWNEAVDWLLNSRHTADPNIQGPFWAYVDGLITRDELDTFSAEGGEPRDCDAHRAEVVKRWQEREWIDVEPAEVLHRLLGDINECEHDIHGDPTACYRDVMTAFMGHLIDRGWTPPDEPHSAADLVAAAEGGEPNV